MWGEGGGGFGGRRGEEGERKGGLDRVEEGGGKDGWYGERVESVEYR